MVSSPSYNHLQLIPQPALGFSLPKTWLLWRELESQGCVKAIHRGLALRGIFTAMLHSQSCPECLRPNTDGIPAQLQQGHEEQCTAGCCEDESLSRERESPKASCWSIPCSLEPGLYPKHTGRMHLQLQLSLHSDFKQITLKFAANIYDMIKKGIK